MSLRTDLIAYLTELLPTVEGLEDVKLVGSVRELGEIASPTLIVKTDALSKMAAAPRNNYQGEFTLTLVSPHQNIDRAEDDLEARLELLLPTLFTWGLSWQSATQVGYGERNLAYDIRTTSIYKRSA